MEVVRFRDELGWHYFLSDGGAGNPVLLSLLQDSLARSSIKHLRDELSMSYRRRRRDIVVTKSLSHSCHGSRRRRAGLGATKASRSLS